MASILLIEDVLKNYRNSSLCRFLEDQGHEVCRVVADGEELLMPAQLGDIAIIHVGHRPARPGMR